MSPSNLRVGAVRDKAPRPMHAIRTFLGADDEFSNLPGGVSKDCFISLFVCLWPGFLRRFVACGSVFLSLVYSWRFGSGVGLRVRSLCLRFSVVRGSRFLSLIYTGDSGWDVCPVALFATLSGSWF